MDSTIITAYSIAKDSLRSCYDKRGILDFGDVLFDSSIRSWAWASFGALRLEDYDVVEKTLDLFLRNQREDGLIPIRVSKGSAFDFVSKTDTNSKEVPTYYVSQPFSFTTNPSADSNFLLIIAFDRFTSIHKDILFVNRFLDRIKKAFDYQLLHSKDYLVKEGNFAGFLEAITKNGMSLYTNVLFFKAALCMSSIMKLINDYESSAKYLDLAQKIRSKLNEKFWLGEFYGDVLDPKNLKAGALPYFSVDGNMLAVIWGLADSAQAKKVLSYYVAVNQDKQLLSRTVYPKYPGSYVRKDYRIMAKNPYNSEALWPWLGCLVAMAFKAGGYESEAVNILSKIAQSIVKYKECYLIYDDFGVPFKTPFYSPKAKCALTSGVFIESYEYLS